MTAPLPPPGWYPDPSGAMGQRYWDGVRWTTNIAPIAPMPMMPAAAPAGVIVTGPNHVLHLILTLLTFPFCGGWIWIWLLIALSNKKRVQAVDAYGQPIRPVLPALAAGPPRPRLPSPIAAWFKALDGDIQAAVVTGIVLLVVVVVVLLIAFG